MSSSRRFACLICCTCSCGTHTGIYRFRLVLHAVDRCRTQKAAAMQHPQGARPLTDALYRMASPWSESEGTTCAEDVWQVSHLAITCDCHRACRGKQNASNRPSACQHTLCTMYPFVSICGLARTPPASPLHLSREVVAVMLSFRHRRGTSCATPMSVGRVCALVVARVSYSMCWACLPTFAASGPVENYGL